MRLPQAGIHPIRSCGRHGAAARAQMQVPVPVWRGASTDDLKVHGMLSEAPGMPRMVSLSDALPEQTHAPAYIGRAGRWRRGTAGVQVCLRGNEARWLICCEVLAGEGWVVTRVRGAASAVAFGQCSRRPGPAAAPGSGGAGRLRSTKEGPGCISVVVRSAASPLVRRPGPTPPTSPASLSPHRGRTGKICSNEHKEGAPPEQLAEIEVGLQQHRAHLVVGRRRS